MLVALRVQKCAHTPLKYTSEQELTHSCNKNSSSSLATAIFIMSMQKLFLCNTVSNHIRLCLFAGRRTWVLFLETRLLHTHLFFYIGLNCTYCIMWLHSHLEYNTSFKLLFKTKPDQSEINDNKTEVVEETTDVRVVKKDDNEV